MFPTRRLLAAIVFLLQAARVPAPAADTRDDPNAISLQITALEMLHRFQASREQLDAVLKLAKSAAAKDGTRKPAKVTENYRKLQQALRDAYVSGDEDAILNKSADLEELRDKEDPALDDDAALTDAARKAAPAGLKVFTARQVALYLSEFAEEFPDPLEKITETFDDGRALKGRDWEAARDLVSEQVGWLVGGVDAEAEAKVRKQVAELLDRAHSLKDADFHAKKAELTKQAKEISGAAGPADVLRNFLERSVAELLSNPQTVPALEARLRKVK
jgi:hypothetical protein